MRLDELEKQVVAAHCRVLGWEDAANDPHRQLLGHLILGFPGATTTILCEPSLARSSRRPPDIVLIDTIAGVHVIEVKGHDLMGIEGIEPGGLIAFRYDNTTQKRNPISQVRNAMFDIKNATEQAYEGELTIPFKYWVVFPRIRKNDWFNRWGKDAYCPPEFQFAEDCSKLADRLRAVGERQLANVGLSQWPAEQLAALGKAFGDSAVLFHRSEEREGRRTREGTLGETFDAKAESYKTLSDEQQRLSSQNWIEGPRLVRGVAGSGKTIVLANNLARRLQRTHRERGLFVTEPQRLLVVCNNRSLVPFLQRKIGLAYEQRTGQPLPPDCVEVISYNRLVYRLSQRGLWRYQRVEEEADDARRAANYLADLANTKRDHREIFDAAVYDAVFVDEGQDFHEDDLRLLKELCKTHENHEPNIYVFYDDAQNFLGRRRPNWSSIGINVRGGRSHIMSHCFRNTCPIVEAAFNVLYGSFAESEGEVPTREFGDLATLEEKNAIVRDADGFWRVGFAVRDGLRPKFTLTNSLAAENDAIIRRLRWLIEEQQVRPQDILILSLMKRRIDAIAAALASTKLAGVDGLHVTHQERDTLLGQRATLTLSTTASAKGYDAYCVLLASANVFDTDVIGRINFYVGCTRAIEYLEVFASRDVGLAVEFRKVLDRQAQV